MECELIAQRRERRLYLKSVDETLRRRPGKRKKTSETSSFVNICTLSTSSPTYSQPTPTPRSSNAPSTIKLAILPCSQESPRKQTPRNSVVKLAAITQRNIPYLKPNEGRLTTKGLNLSAPIVSKSSCASSARSIGSAPSQRSSKGRFAPSPTADIYFVPVKPPAKKAKNLISATTDRLIPIQQKTVSIPAIKHNTNLDMEPTAVTIESNHQSQTSTPVDTKQADSQQPGTKTSPDPPTPKSPAPKPVNKTPEKKVVSAPAGKKPVEVSTEQKPHSSTSLSSPSTEEFKPKISMPNNNSPTYFIGGGNGVGLIQETLDGLGWTRIKEKTDERYKLKWCELKSAINYSAFKEGDQMVNHIPNCNLLTNKLGLINSLQEYEKIQLAVKKGRGQKLALSDFVPETYRLDDPKDREAFYDTYSEGEIWISKPTGRNQGKGIYLVRSLQEVKSSVDNHLAAQQQLTERGKASRPMNRVIQRYISNPLLLNGKKFDIRCYLLIANMVPYLVLFHHGYVRVAMFDYDNSCDNLIAHLTNQFIQKRDATYKDNKEETVWSMERFNEYVNEKVAPEKGIEKDWVNTTLLSRMKQISTYCFNAVKHRLHAKIGYSDLYGMDFMIDQNMKVWLIEVNVNPCLATNCEALKAVVPNVVKETLHICIECFEKSRRGRPLMPVQSIKGFQMLYHGGGSKTANGTAQTSKKVSNTPTRGHIQSPTRRSMSTSPVKDVSDANRTRASYTKQTLATQKPGYRAPLTPYTPLHGGPKPVVANSNARTRESTQMTPRSKPVIANHDTAQKEVRSENKTEMTQRETVSPIQEEPDKTKMKEVEKTDDRIDKERADKIAKEKTDKEKAENDKSEKEKVEKEVKETSIDTDKSPPNKMASKHPEVIKSKSPRPRSKVTASPDQKEKNPQRKSAQRGPRATQPVNRVSMFPPLLEQQRSPYAISAQLADPTVQARLKLTNTTVTPANRGVKVSVKGQPRVVKKEEEKFNRGS